MLLKQNRKSILFITCITKMDGIVKYKNDNAQF